MKHPEQLGKYPITGVIGEGAMGVVYKAFDPIIQRPVAIKTIRKHLVGEDLSGSSTAERFRNEAQAVGRMSHPNIVPIYEYGEDDDTAFIAMEYVEGRTLSKILAATPRLPEVDILKLMDQLLDALDCAHRHGVWHRDIKPANLMVTNAGQLKVTDFGIARIESQVLTQMTSTIGTPGYMAPEQYVGENVDHRVDVFAAGVLLYGMLVGQSPFRGSPEAVMYKVMNDTPVAPSRIDIAPRPDFYDSIVARAMAKKPQDRFATAALFRQALARRVLPSTEDESETTVIMAPPRPAPPPSADPHAPTAVLSAGSAGSVRTTAAPTGWDPQTLARVELALASFVGPVAKVLVRNAARFSTDLPSLAAKVCEHLGSDADRARFTAKLGATGTQAASHPVNPSLPTGHHALTDEMVTQSRKVLTAHLGPIAGVLVKKAQAKAQSQEQFLALLAENATAGKEREKLIEALRRGP
jgi:serine/threonine-protein kinase